jgi:hypothetical protein
MDSISSLMTMGTYDKSRDTWVLYIILTEVTILPYMVHSLAHTFFVDCPEQDYVLKKLHFLESNTARVRRCMFPLTLVKAQT